MAADPGLVVMAVTLGAGSNGAALPCGGGQLGGELPGGAFVGAGADRVALGTAKNLSQTAV
jgi:hypothetical protein